MVRGRKNLLHVQLPKRLKDARKEAGHTRMGLSLLAGLGNNAVSRIEDEGRMPTIDTVEQLARALGVAPSWLAFGIHAAQPPKPSAGCQQVGARLRRVRGARAYSVRALGELAGVSGAAVSAIENKPHMPSLATIEKLAKALDVSPAWLAFGSDDGSKAQTISTPLPLDR